MPNIFFCWSPITFLMDEHFRLRPNFQVLSTRFSIPMEMKHDALYSSPRNGKGNERNVLDILVDIAHHRFSTQTITPVLGHTLESTDVTRSLIVQQQLVQLKPH